MRSTLERFQTSKLLPLKERLGQYHYTLDVSEMGDDRYQFYRRESLQTLDRNPNCLSDCLQLLYFQWTCLSTSPIACLCVGKRFAGTGLKIRSILQVWTLWLSWDDFSNFDVHKILGTHYNHNNTQINASKCLTYTSKGSEMTSCFIKDLHLHGFVVLLIILPIWKWSYCLLSPQRKHPSGQVVCVGRWSVGR